MTYLQTTLVVITQWTITLCEVMSECALEQYVSNGT